jgi:hypothetical protein
MLVLYSTVFIVYIVQREREREREKGKGEGEEGGGLRGALEKSALMNK